MDTIAKALQLAAEKKGSFEEPDWPTFAGLWGAFEAMADDGSIVVIKLDGGRQADVDLPKRYTVVVSGGKLGNDFFHKDTSDLALALSQAGTLYAGGIWKNNTHRKLS